MHQGKGSNSLRVGTSSKVGRLSKNALVHKVRFSQVIYALRSIGFIITFVHIYFCLGSELGWNNFTFPFFFFRSASCFIAYRDSSTSPI